MNRPTTAAILAIALMGIGIGREARALPHHYFDTVVALETLGLGGQSDLGALESTWDVNLGLGYQYRFDRTWRYSLRVQGPLHISPGPAYVLKPTGSPSWLFQVATGASIYASQRLYFPLQLVVPMDTDQLFDPFLLSAQSGFGWELTSPQKNALCLEYLARYDVLVPNGVERGGMILLALSWQMGL